jgi:DNA-binding response OmpR family regulator
MSNLRRSILIVDDEPLIAETLSLILRDAGFEPHIAHNGVAALELARRVRPDLMLTDVILPGMNGLELAVKVRELLPTSRILLFSGQAVTADLLEIARKARGEEFEVLPKPLDPEELLARLRA